MIPFPRPFTDFRCPCEVIRMCSHDRGYSRIMHFSCLRRNLHNSGSRYRSTGIHRLKLLPLKQRPPARLQYEGKKAYHFCIEVSHADQDLLWLHNQLLSGACGQVWVLLHVVEKEMGKLLLSHLHVWDTADGLHHPSKPCLSVITSTQVNGRKYIERWKRPVAAVRVYGHCRKALPNFPTHPTLWAFLVPPSLPGQLMNGSDDPDDDDQISKNFDRKYTQEKSTFPKASIQSSSTCLHLQQVTTCCGPIVFTGLCPTNFRANIFSVIISSNSRRWCPSQLIWPNFILPTACSSFLTVCLSQNPRKSSSPTHAMRAGWQLDSSPSWGDPIPLVPLSNPGGPTAIFTPPLPSLRFSSLLLLVILEHDPSRDEGRSKRDLNDFALFECCYPPNFPTTLPQLHLCTNISNTTPIPQVSTHRLQSLPPFSLHLLGFPSTSAPRRKHSPSSGYLPNIPILVKAFTFSLFRRDEPHWGKQPPSRVSLHVRLISSSFRTAKH
ncbi:hypothetical protein VP01_1761g2 [Puccinia sorghi]|uniref:Uncharacterized protein n=1 Tax=Puccinia sorghi TaxID=27349 RepID=A0A0L6VEV2_9BASI|nr:hypothetical protein VP01_1761g2 [Puccinia sorghi]